MDEVLANVSSGGVLRNIGESNQLDSANLASVYEITLEAQDPAGGDQLKEVRVNVGFVTDPDINIDTVSSLSLFQTMSASEFTLENSTTINGLRAATFSTTYEALLNFVGETQNEVSVGDRFVIDFEMVLIDDRVFNIDNATLDIVTTGTFSFFNSQFRYSASVQDLQRVFINENGAFVTKNENKLGILSTGQADTVFVTFSLNNDPTTPFSGNFITNPLVSQVSAVSATGGDLGTIGTLTQKNGGSYYFLYTAGTVAQDTIDFVVSGGEAITGFVMKDDTLSGAYIIDNTPPAAMIGATRLSIDASNNIASVSVDLMYEPLGKDTVDFQVVATGTTIFDTQTFTKVIVQGDELVNIEFAPQQAGVLIPEGALTFDIITDPTATTGAGVIDLIGNQAVERINVALGN